MNLETSTNTEAPGEKAKKYLTSIETVLSGVEIVQGSCNVSEKSIRSIVDAARSYVDDAKHYLKEKPSTALAAVSYAEGLLDALKLLEVAKFAWPSTRGDKH